jgi:hypothetical protein
MKFIITDWASNVCFDSHISPFDSFEDGWNFIYQIMVELYGDDYDESELENYEVVPLTKTNRIEYSYQRPVLRHAIKGN